MTLYIESLSFKDFRSYESLELGEIGQLTVFVGPNAAGKTNIVEGIQLLTALTTFRRATTDQLIRKGAASAKVSANFRDGQRLLEVSLAIENHAKHYKLNGKAKRPSEMRGMAPSVVFAPDDLNLVKGPMSFRRHALDALGAQLNANYAQIVRDYEKVLRHKNRLLKEEASQLLIESIDEMVIACGAQLTCYRASLFRKLLPYLSGNYEGIVSGKERFTAQFTPSWSEDGFEPSAAADIDRNRAREEMAHALELHRAEERARHRSVVGPQSDRIAFFIDGMDASVFGSQGQQRSIVLAYKLAEAAIIEEMLGLKPIMLLDDVMSELDGKRREALVSYLLQDNQSFVTTANLAYFDQAMLDRATIVNIPFTL